jgi:hypothetical protein
MRPNVRNVGNPNAVWLGNIKLLLQMVRRHRRGLPFAMTRTAVIAGLGPQQRLMHQPMDTIAATGLA